MSDGGHSLSEAEDDRRVVIHFDLDAFYVACERELNPALRGVPVAVSQYNPYGTLEEKAAHEVDRRLVVRPSDGHANNDDCNGSLIAVSYEARTDGVRRNDRGLDASRKCPELRIVQVPVKHGKADLTLYRSASSRVMDVLARALRDETEKFGTIQVEIASIDEVYVDVTEPAQEMACRMQCQEAFGDDADLTWKNCIDESSVCTTIGGVEILSVAAEAANALNKDEVRRGSRLQVLDSTKQFVDDGSRAWWHRNASEWTSVEIRLACGAFLAARARAAVSQAFDGGVFTLSAGVSSNKTLAKLASGLKKPNRQTLVNRMDAGALEKLFHPLPLGRIRGLGGKFGEEVHTKLNVSTVGDLALVPLTTLKSEMSCDENTARFLWDIARGICRDAVTERTKVKSIACGKTFRGKLSIDSSDTSTLGRWTGELCSELTERLLADWQKNNRVPTTLVVSVTTSDQRKSVSKQCRAPRTYDGYTDTALQLILQLVEAARSRARTSVSAVPASKISITGLAISATSFVDVAAGSSSIVAAFQRSAKNNSVVGKGSGSVPRTISSMLEAGRANGTKKSSVMDQWLSQTQTSKLNGMISSPGGSSIGKKREGSLGSKRRLQQAGTIQRYLGGASASSKKVGNARPESVALPTLEEIDPTVLGELPEDLRISLMKDLDCQGREKKRGSIRSFLER